MTILSIDPGITLGYTLYTFYGHTMPGRIVSQIKFDQEDVADRIRKAGWWLIRMIVDYQPNVVIIEKPPSVHRNAMALAVLFDQICKTVQMFENIEVHTVYPQTWRAKLGIKKRKHEKNLKESTLRRLQDMGFKVRGYQHDAIDSWGLALWYIKQNEKLWSKLNVKE